jgi:hypothetical protein
METFGVVMYPYPMNKVFWKYLNCPNQGEEKTTHPTLLLAHIAP